MGPGFSERINERLLWMLLARHAPPRQDPHAIACPGATPPVASASAAAAAVLPRYAISSGRGG
ncbi:hypothetical protein IscW_ISCW002855, partial [Ixodes scapularis]